MDKAKGLIIIDFEFTWLDKFSVSNNEIVSLSFLEVETWIAKSYNFKNTVPMSIGAILKTGITDKMLKGEIHFSRDFFDTLFEADCQFLGFGISEDKYMLEKYGIVLHDYEDLQEKLRLNTKYEKDIAIQGSSLEVCYYLVMNKIFDKKHCDTNEVKAMYEIWEKVKDDKLNDYLNYFPFGYYGWTELKDYVIYNRSAADWYRYNNDDKLSESLYYYIWNDYE